MEADSYRYDFDENAGYDCMYGGFTIYDAADHRILTVDLADHGQKACEHPIPEDAKARAEKLTKFIVDALNASSSHATPLQEGKS
jgi:hypothetical protein